MSTAVLPSDAIVFGESILDLISFFQQNGYLQGTVKRKGKPVKGATVYAVDTTTGQVKVTFLTAVDGVYRLFNLVPNREYHIFCVYRDAYGTYNPKPYVFTTPVTTVPEFQQVPCMPAAIEAQEDFEALITQANAFETDLIVDWLSDQMRSKECNEPGFNITVPDGIGPRTINGTYTLPQGLASNQNPISLDSEIENGYDGPINGTLSLQDPNQYRIAVYIRISMNADSLQGTPVNVSPQGEWQFPGTGISGNNGGTLVFKVVSLVDLTPLYPEYVNQVTSSDGEIRDYEVVHETVTDIGYEISTTRCTTAGSFTFNYVESGNYRASIRHIPSGRFVAQTSFATNLPRSYVLQIDSEQYQTPLPDRCYLYDAALALLFATWNGDTVIADRIIEGLLDSQLASGAFPFSVLHNYPNPSGNDPIVRTGAAAWVGYALCEWYKVYGKTSQKGPAVRTSVEDFTIFLSTIHNTASSEGQGTFRGGFGRYVNNEFVLEYIVPWCSTEHHIDLWFFFDSLRAVTTRNLGGNTPLQWRDLVGFALKRLFWMPSNNRFAQGIDFNTLAQDTTDALDCNSWGHLFLDSAQTTRICGQNLRERCEEVYKVNVDGVQGYKPYSADYGYPSAINSIWAEGTFGVALMWYRGGNMKMYKLIMDSIQATQLGDKSFLYGVLRDELYEVTNNPSVASTMWYILTRNHPDKLWTTSDLPLT